MKLFIAGLTTETNSFSPMPTGHASFVEGGIFHGDATAHPLQYWNAALHIWREMAEARGWEVVESLCAAAQPGGPTVKPEFEAFRDEILSDLRAAGHVDVILLGLHGAMIADGYDDCEGELIAGARAIAPDAVIGGLLDPHCHLTEQMLTKATLLIAFKEYPHVDVPDRARELFALAERTARGEITPVMRDWDCRMIIAMPTPQQPMRGFVDAMSAREAEDGILSLSLAHGFPWGDHPRTGARAFAITDGNADQAAAEAERLGRALYDLRFELHRDIPGIEAALDLAEAAPKGPIVLADMSDNAGGGAPADATFLLRAMIERGMRSIATGIFWDPIAVRICKEAGIGATLQLRLGGKCGPMSGDPLDLTVTVRNIADAMTQRFGELPSPMGQTVWVEADGIDIVINDNRSQTFHPDAFEKLGIDLSQRRYVCVKSSNHYQAGFNPIAAQVIPVATPGAITPDFANIPYTKRARTYWPAVQDPFA
ncbi:MAG: microcystin LR degradation protein MlrC-like protein [Hoeflea sp. BRH_c9]|nr:MAG: microcystin LR degradation protein MlrC-like protein [Hoeflea sp. BRH_c9]